MDQRNRIGLYGAYFCGMAGIGFTLPYLPLYLRGEGFSDRAISFVSALTALVGVAQFPIGLWSDRLGRRKPFLVTLLAVLALATVLLPMTHGLLLVSLLVLLVAENGVCRATVESRRGLRRRKWRLHTVWARHWEPCASGGRPPSWWWRWRPSDCRACSASGGC
jgi:hypothetical protein